MTHQRLYLLGFFRPVPDVYSFVVPVFSDGTQEYLQTIENDTISGWETIQVHDNSPIIPIKTDLTRVISEAAVFAFEDYEEKFIFGSRKEMYWDLVKVIHNNRTPLEINQSIFEFTQKVAPTLSGKVKTEFNKSQLQLILSCGIGLPSEEVFWELDEQISSIIGDSNLLSQIESLSISLKGLSSPPSVLQSFMQVGAG